LTNIFDLYKKPKSGLKRVSDRKSNGGKDERQLDLFWREKGKSNILEMTSNLPPFEEALILDERDDPKAKEAYLNAIIEDDCRADAYCNLGILEYKSGNIVKAIDSFSKSLMIDARHFESHYNMANLYSELCNLPLARMHYEFARELKPDFPDICFNLGIVYAMSRDFDSALKILTEYKEMVTAEESAITDKLIQSIKKLSG
jgi:tetratricopeptide (TPR) repeat protein